jgi:proteasome assembly chaperone (PAC2) family protein
MKASNDMAEVPRLQHPWLIAVWPGMGGVGLSAGYYLLARLGMHLLGECEAEVFDVDHVEVKEGIIQPAQRPRNRLFVWSGEGHPHDLVLVLGEAQPPVGKYAFCRQLIARAKELGVERVLTFAAMATQMHPQAPSRVFGAATDHEGLEELKRLGLAPLEGGHIGGLNGVLLGAAAEAGLRGACLLGEMPHIFAQVPFPKASLAVLRSFTALAGIELDLGELAAQARAVEQQLTEALARAQGGHVEAAEEEEEESAPEPAEEERLALADRERLEGLFRAASADRARTFELKQELDRLGVFKEYEDRFLDLFKQGGPS